MLIIFLKIIGGILLLLLGGKYLVKGSVELTKYFSISKLVVGMTVVAFGTSAPELLVSLQAAIKGSPEIALGNVVGSNIANIALVLAASIIILPIFVKKQTIKIDWPIMMVASIMLFVFMFDDKLTRIEGVIFFGSLIAYIWWEIRYSFKQSKAGKGDEKSDEKKIYSIPVAILVIAVSAIGLAKGADFLVQGASQLASELGVSERIISITIVAVGTSLPELTASIIAALKKETDISVGNIIGSNIFNIFAILGLTALIHPIQIDAQEHFNFMQDQLWMIGIGVLLFFAFLPLKKKYMNRYKGVIFLGVYITYILLLFLKK